MTEDSWSREIILLASVLAIIGIVVGIIVITNYYQPSEKIPVLRYRGFLFYQKAGFWHFDWQRDAEHVYTVSLRFNPAEATSVPLEGEGVDTFNKYIRNTRTVYITFDPLSNNFTYTALAAGELSLSIAQALDITPIAACTVNETETCRDRPIITCDTKDVAVIYLDNDEDNPKIVQKDNCLIISGRGMEKLRAVDRVLYHWYKVY